MVGEAMPMQARSRYYPRLADAKLLLRLTACKSLSTEAQQRFSMGTVLTHPFLCLNRYKQISKTTSIICYHSDTYGFTSKPEKGGLGADEACYCQPLHKRIVQTTLLIIADCLA